MKLLETPYNAAAIKKAMNLNKRLNQYSSETLGFMNDITLPFTNNSSERNLRMTKVKEKVSGCFRSLDGAKYFARIRSYILTCQKHGMDANEAFKILFSGTLPDFLKST